MVVKWSHHPVWCTSLQRPAKGEATSGRAAPGRPAPPADRGAVPVASCGLGSRRGWKRSCRPGRRDIRRRRQLATLRMRGILPALWTLAPYGRLWKTPRAVVVPSPPANGVSHSRPQGLENRRRTVREFGILLQRRFPTAPTGPTASTYIYFLKSKERSDWIGSPPLHLLHFPGAHRHPGPRRTRRAPAPERAANRRQHRRDHAARPGGPPHRETASPAALSSL
jgi:hypothetical protein